MKILIVDDSCFMRTIIKNSLKTRGFNDFDEASNGLEALNKYKNTHYDYVTMDITMDTMNGLDSLKAIKEYDSNAKVIMVTSMGQKTLVLEAIKYGAIDFIVKPFTNKVIDETIEKIKENKTLK